MQQQTSHIVQSIGLNMALETWDLVQLVAYVVAREGHDRCLRCILCICCVLWLLVPAVNQALLILRRDSYCEERTVNKWLTDIVVLLTHLFELLANHLGLQLQQVVLLE